MVDSISDLIIQIKNAGMAGRRKIELPFSNLRYSVAKKLYNQNYLAAVEKGGHGVKKKLVITLAYDSDGRHSVQDVQRISKPGRRVYSSGKDVLPVKNGKGCAILTTPKGILTGYEARKEHVGGEVLFKIW